MDQIEKPLAILLITATLIFAALNFTNTGISAPEASLNNGVSMEGVATNETVETKHISMQVKACELKTEAVDTFIAHADTIWWFDEGSGDEYYEIIKLDTLSSEQE